jgi:nucleoside-diphosphate-sugar epimerase
MIKKKIYVLGDKGRIGSAMIRECTVEGYDTVGMDIDDGWDFTERESWSRLGEEVGERADQPWGLVNCTYPKDFMDHIEIAYSTILYGAMIGFRRIVNISSIYGMRGQNPNMYKGSKIRPASLMYNAAKAYGPSVCVKLLLSHTRNSSCQWRGCGQRGYVLDA